MDQIIKKTELSGRELSLKTGQIAPQANGSVIAQWGDTVVLATATIDEPREGIDFFPLRVDYIERLYAGGIIKGSRFVKRERAPRDEIILADRMIDRAIRPLFAEGLRHDVQIIVLPVSVDRGSDPDLLSLIATSAALAISDIPWDGPVGAARMGLVQEGETEKIVLNPPIKDLETSKMDIIVAGSEEKVIMLDAEAEGIPDDLIADSIEKAQSSIKQTIQLIEELQSVAGKEKIILAEEEKDKAKEKAREEIKKLTKKDFIPKIVEAGKIVDEKKDEFQEILHEKFEGKLSKSEMDKEVEEATKKEIRRLIINQDKRLDGRAMDEIRPLTMETGLFPRTHGSALFQRGKTQVINITTLGSTSLEQLIEGMLGEKTKRYMHHYYFPPFSTGQVWPLRSPKRREVGHGALAEKALKPVIPDEEEFPYAMRLVSEVTSSAGSTSMAATCASSLSLMDAGVPIKKPVAGIAMGLITEKDKKYKILTDMHAIEDFYGDMDLKITGTEDGITAIQLDVKNQGLTIKIVRETFRQARDARLKILKEMQKAISSPRRELSEFAPRITRIKIDPSKIGQVIGSGGKVIRSIIEETGVAIDVEDDGTVLISSPDPEQAEKAKKIVEELTHEVTVGEIYEGEVTRVENFGAFVEILPGKEGLIPISELEHYYVKEVEDSVKVGDTVRVKVIEIDNRGRINLSKKALQKSSSKEKRNKDKGKKPYYRRPGNHK